MKAQEVALWSVERAMEQVRILASAERVTEAANIGGMRCLASVVKARERSTARSACGAMGLASSSQPLRKPAGSAVEQGIIQQLVGSAAGQAALLSNAKSVMVLAGISSS